MATDQILGIKAVGSQTTEEPVQNVLADWVPEEEFYGKQQEQFNLEDWVPEEQLLSEDDQDALVLDAFQGSIQPEQLGLEDKRSAIVRMAEVTGLPIDYVESNFDETYRSWAASEFDPRRWRMENPVLAREFMRKTQSGYLVVGDEKVSQITRLLRKAHASSVLDSDSFHTHLDELKTSDAPWYEKMFGAIWNVLSHGKPTERPTNEQVEGAELDLARMKGEAPMEKVTFLQDARATEGQQGGLIDRFRLSLEDAELGLEYSSLHTQIMKAKMLGQDTWELEKKVVDLKGQMVPRDYGQGGWEQILTDIANAAPSQVQTLKGGGIGAAVGYVGTGAGALLLTRSPGAAHRAGMKGASILGKAGAAAASFDMIAGGAYAEFRQHPGVDDEVAIGAAVVEGMAGTLIEMASFGATLRSFGPLGEAFSRGEGRAFIRQMLADTNKRQVFRRAAKAWAESGFTEFGEEFAQSILHSVIDTTITDSWSEADAIKRIEMVDEGLQAGISALAPAFAMGSAGMATTMLQNRFLRDRSAISANRVQTLFEASDLAISKADPEFMARVVAEETKASGEEVTELYADAESVQQILMENGADPAQLFGEDVAKNLHHAAMSGGQVSIPVAQYFQAAKKNRELTGKLNDHLVTRPDYVPPAHSKAEDAQVKADADEIYEMMKEEAAEAEAKAKGTEGAADKPKKPRRKVSAAEQKLADDVMKMLVDSGRYTPEDAMYSVALMRALIRTQARVEAPDPKQAQEYEDKLFGHYSMIVNLEPEQVAQMPEGAVAQPFGFFRPKEEALTDGEKHQEAAAFHLRQMKFWQAQSNDARANEHLQMYNAHVSALGLDPNGPTPLGIAELEQPWTASEYAKADYEALKRNPPPRTHPADRLLRPRGPLARLQSRMFQTAFHGGPRFDQFSLDYAKLGVIGFGHYFSTDAMESDSYRVASAGQYDLTYAGNSLMERSEHWFAPLAKLWYDNSQGKDPEAARKAVQTRLKLARRAVEEKGTDPLEFGFNTVEDIAAAQEWLAMVDPSQLKAQRSGQLYKVSLPEDTELLNMGATMEQQNPEVLKRLEQAGLYNPAEDAFTSALHLYEDLAERHGGHRNLSEALAAAGVPGGYDRGFAEGSKHVVMWDDSRIKIDHRYYQGTTHLYNGYTERVDNLFGIMLSPHANLSTFLHESGHVFFEMMRDLAMRDGASQRIKDDYQAALKFMGKTEKQLEAVKLNISSIYAAAKREGRELNEKETEQVMRLTEPWERFARGFEAFLREGKAPSAKLRRAFMRFQMWLTSIYEKASDLDIELNDEIRGVFSRLLATDREIRATQRRMGLQPFWKTKEEMAKDLGREVSDKEWLEYLDTQEEAASHGVMAANFAAMKDELKEKTRWWKNEASNVRLQANRDYEQLPERQAWLFMQGKGLDEQGRVVQMGSPTLLHRPTLIQMLGEKRARRFHGVSTDDGWKGIHPDQFAKDFGFKTGAEMIEAIENLKPKKAWVKREVEDRMQRRFPGLHNDINELRSVVEKGLHGDRTLKWLMFEIKALRERVKAPPTERVLKSGPRKGEKVQGRKFMYPHLDSIKMAAQRMASEMTIGQLNSHRILQTERKLAEKAMRAAARGDFEQALVLKYKQVFNMYLYSAVNHARDRRAKFLDLAKVLRKDSVRRRIAKGVLTDERGQVIDRGPLILLDGIDTTLEALSLRSPVERDRPPFNPREVVQAIVSSGGIPPEGVDLIEQIIQKPRSYKDLTVQEMEQVYNYLRNVRKSTERKSVTMLSDGTYLDTEEVEAGLIADAERNRVDRGPDTGEDTKLSTRLSNLGNSLNGSWLKIETMLDFLSGGDRSSFWHRAIGQVIQNAKHRKHDLIVQVVKPILEKLDNIPESVKWKFNKPIDGAALFPNHRNDIVDPPSTVKHIVMLVLNSGTASSSSRLLQGRGITLEQVQTAAALHLDKEVMDWIQSIWDASKPLWPLEADLQERLTGVRPKKLEHQKFETPWGTYEGGYFHLTYRWKVPTDSVRSATVQTAEDVLDPSYIRPTTPHSHLMERVKDFDGVVELDNMATIYRSVVQAAHDLAYREALLSVANVLLRPKVQRVLKRRLGAEMAPQLLQWLRDIGLEHSAKGTVHAGAMNRAVRVMKSSLAIGYLGHKPSVWLGDFGNLVKAVLVTPLTKESWLEGIEEFLSAPFDTRQMAIAKSGELRALGDNTIREYHNEIQRIQSRNPLRKFGPIAWFVDTAFTAAQKVTELTSIPIWTGAYRQKLRELGDRPDAEQQAVEFADSIVRRVFPSHNIVDQAALLRDPGYMGASTMFFSYLSTAYNQQAVLLDPVMQEARRSGTLSMAVAKRLAKVSGKLFAFYFVHNALEEFLMGRGPESGDGDDVGERYAKWLARKMLLASFTTMPWANEAAGMIEWALLGRQASVRASPVASFAQELGRAGTAIINGEWEDEKEFMQLYKAGGVMFGYPTFPITGSAQYLIDLKQGDVEAEDIFDVASGILYGHRPGQPQNPFRPLTPGEK